MAVQGNLQSSFRIRLLGIGLHRLSEALHEFLHILALVLILKPEGLILNQLLLLGQVGFALLLPPLRRRWLGWHRCYLLAGYSNLKKSGFY